jgi:hypothetical protein
MGYASCSGIIAAGRIPAAWGCSLLRGVRARNEMKMGLSDPKDGLYQDTATSLWEASP